jgi:hypothetical protein
MGLEELRRVIAESDRGDWNVISCFASAIDGPSYLFSPWLVIDHEAYPEREHHARASYRPDLSIGLAWGMHSNDNFEEEWVQNLSNKSAFSGIADILLNGMLVDRQYYVVVDEGRARNAPCPALVSQPHQTARSVRLLLRRPGWCG